MRNLKYEQAHTRVSEKLLAHFMNNRNGDDPFDAIQLKTLVKELEWSFIKII